MQISGGELTRVLDKRFVDEIQERSIYEGGEK